MGLLFGPAVVFRLALAVSSTNVLCKGIFGQARQAFVSAAVTTIPFILTVARCSSWVESVLADFSFTKIELDLPISKIVSEVPRLLNSSLVGTEDISYVVGSAEGVGVVSRLPPSL